MNTEINERGTQTMTTYTIYIKTAETTNAHHYQNSNRFVRVETIKGEQAMQNRVSELGESVKSVYDNCGRKVF